MSSSKTETRILLLRHAETSAPHRFHGAESDVGLGENGLTQAATAAAWLSEMKPEALYSSSLRRAVQTAEVIADACQLSVELVPDLRERQMGSLSGKLKTAEWSHYHQAKVRWTQGDLHATHEGAETFAQIQGRVEPALTRIAKKHPGQTVVVVAHGVVIRVLLTTLLEGYSPADFDQISIPFVGVNDLRTDASASRWWAAGLNVWSPTTADDPFWNAKTPSP